MVTTTPLLLLLDGILSQDAARTSIALQQIHELVNILPLDESPLRSAGALERIIQTLMTSHPNLAKIASRNDASLPLHFAASIGNIRVARLLLEKHRQAALTPNSKGKIPLHYAAREGRTDMVQFMLDSVPETASVLSKKGKLPLHFAAGDGHTEIVQALLKVNPAGASLPSKKGKVALHFAARWGHMDIARDLVEAYPTGVTTLDYDGSLPLHDAAREGQLDMAKFLVDSYPQGLRKENIRGETPLFPAIQSGNKDLCTFLLQLWPGGGKQILRMVSEDDNFREWEDGLLDLCLRGAVDDDLVGRNNPKTSSFRAGADTACSSSRRVSSSSSHCDHHHHHSTKTSVVDKMMTHHRHVQDDDKMTILTPSSAVAASALAETTNSTLEISLPRSKSPILVEEKNPKKRSQSFDWSNNSNKKSCKNCKMEHDFSYPLEAAEASCSSHHHRHHRCFFQLHAALECGASAPVLDYILNKYPDQVKKVNDLGKLPLHLAAQYSSPSSSTTTATTTEETISIILDRILEPYQDACYQRDFLGRLPLHLALKSRANCRLIRAMLDANPPSAVEDCEIVDPAFNDKKLPIFMATEYQCDLSTVYMLLREDPSVLKKKRDV